METEEKSKAQEDKVRYKAGPVVCDANFHGVRYDFNYGARILVPPGEEMHVRIRDLDTDSILFDTKTQNAIVSSNKKYFINFRIEVWKGEEYFSHDLNLKDKNVLMLLPTRAIGDSIAWLPYAEEFRKQHGCKVYVRIGEHVRSLLKDNYPNLVFLEDKQTPVNCYATYILGVFFPVTDRDHQPMDFRFVGLQKSVAQILGLPPLEIKPYYKATKKRPIEEPYVCIAVQSTTQCKTWNNPLGWIKTIEYLKNLGYRVLCIDKDRTYGTGRLINAIPFGCEDFTGAKPLQERVDLLAHADFFVGISSGLSWLAWASGTPVIMIGGFTLPFNEFYTPYRAINYNTCTGCWHEVEFYNKDYGWCPRHKNTEREFECSRSISGTQVIRLIDQLMQDKGLVVPKNR